MQQVFSILGCGSSGGVPRIGGKWGQCDPSNPKNNRKRCSLLVEQTSADGSTTVLIDTAPEMRLQLIDAGIGAIDAVIYTHSHADHVHGIDDLRQIALNTEKRVPVWADNKTGKDLLRRFDYAFKQAKNSPYPPVLKMNFFNDNIEITGKGGAINFTPIRVIHGSADAFGFRVGDIAYIPDVSEIPAESWAQLKGLSYWIIDALRYAPHPSHTHVEQTLKWIEHIAPKHAILTNMHLDLDYETLRKTLPSHISPAYDGLKIDITL